MRYDPPMNLLAIAVAAGLVTFGAAAVIAFGLVLIEPRDLGTECRAACGGHPVVACRYVDGSVAEVRCR